ncbi:unnamed protein product [Linum tenue]|uniref:Uncharacterized protein n=2 Tax=Linum tenue TaxID=586396 RepID=A0AAV0ILX1_9ROSI|nr:unnamed protein product [Linum tenue]
MICAGARASFLFQGLKLSYVGIGDVVASVFFTVYSCRCTESQCSSRARTR